MPVVQDLWLQDQDQICTMESDTGMDEQPPILRRTDFDRPSAFHPQNLLREARRQRGIPAGDVPEVCILDPDGDIVRHLKAAGEARPNPYWACYHTTLFDFEYRGVRYGIIGCAVGASFAVLVAEQLFVSGCKLLVSMTSAGQIAPRGKLPYFVLIEHALRDEGCSYHYLPASDYSYLRPALKARLNGAFSSFSGRVHRGGSWTTDAPFRETEEAIVRARKRGVLSVEMEAAALYAFAEARDKAVVCFAHVTNEMARKEGDFEKGEADGSRDALEVIAAVARACVPSWEVDRD